MSFEKVIIGNAELYCGDCMEVLPTLGKVDAVITDPPYGIGFKYTDSYKDRGGEAYIEMMRMLAPYKKAILQYPEETMKYLVPLYGAPDECFAWCYNSNIARQFRLWSFWKLDVDFKRVKVPSKNPDDARVNSMVSHYDWTTEYQQVKNVSSEKTDHPCQISSNLMRLVISFLECGDIVDPFMGSGTTGVACMNLDRKFIGIELEPKYFDIACKRIEQAQQQLKLF